MQPRLMLFLRIHEQKSLRSTAENNFSLPDSGEMVSWRRAYATTVPFECQQETNEIEILVANSQCKFFGINSSTNRVVAMDTGTWKLARPAGTLVENFDVEKCCAVRTIRELAVPHKSFSEFL
jgi:hypothetical protein